MNRSFGRQRIRARKGPPLNLKTDPSNQEYRVGPGRPPKEYRWKPGQSGNPKGAPRKPTSIAPELGAIVERSLNGKVMLRQGEQEKTVVPCRRCIDHGALKVAFACHRLLLFNDYRGLIKTVPQFV
jgi:hypothetical protein